MAIYKTLDVKNKRVNKNVNLNTIFQFNDIVVIIL